MSVIEDDLRKQLAEALRQLRRSTGRDWTTVIESRAKSWIKREVCATCSGLGNHVTTLMSQVVHDVECTACHGEGEIYSVDDSKLHHPDQPPCNGCPNITCNDYELCSKKRDPK